MWPARPPLASVGNVSPVEGIGGTSRRWRFCLLYVVVAAYPSLLAKLKLSRLCALLGALEVRTSSLVLRHRDNKR